MHMHATPCRRKPQRKHFDWKLIQVSGSGYRVCKLH